MIPSDAYIRLLPEIVLTLFGCVVMLAEPMLPPGRSRKPLGAIAFIGCVGAVAATIYQSGLPGEAFFGMIRVDSFSIFFHLLIPSIAALCVLASLEYRGMQPATAGSPASLGTPDSGVSGEYYGLILLGAVGMVLMSSAVELVLIFIALEISSISTYILAGFRRRLAASAESSLKYFLLGSFATAFFLYGVALMFGATGSTTLAGIAAGLRGPHPPALVYLASALMFVGLGFKVASAPFHVWTPDVYEGAPAPVVALLSTAPKAAAFAVLLRILVAAAPGWFWLLWISAALSMTLGNLGALVQSNIKRLLAYSSIAHAGYLLVAFAAAGALASRTPLTASSAAVPAVLTASGFEPMGISAAIFYTAAYAAMNVGAFAVVSQFARAGERFVTLDDYAGLGSRSPLLAATLTLFLLSLIGIPITGGFLAKFYVFSAALKANLVWLTIIGVVNSAVAAYYYLRVIVVMYMREPSDESALAPVPAAVAITLFIAAAATLYMGLWPGSILDFAGRSAAALLQ